MVKQKLKQPQIHLIYTFFKNQENSTPQALLNTIEDLKYQLTFSWYDYGLFSAMFGLSALIGIYFGCFGTKQSTTAEYLLGGKSMKICPVVVSLVSR